ncbi:hypothetical protein CW304_10895 [Bacillus sp. UFRGS-B20]|nr:hypothetical protein CW304_10895 [Bacillus sp. UFRGS-B20]
MFILGFYLTITIYFTDCFKMIFNWLLLPIRIFFWWNPKLLSIHNPLRFYSDRKASTNASIFRKYLKIFFII